MSKFSLFTVFLSLTITVIVGELLVNQYVKYPSSQKDLAANVLNAQTNNGQGTHTAATQQSSQAPANSGAAVNSGSANAGAGIPASTLPKITFAALQNAGFTNMVLQRVPFNGILFNTIDLRDFKSVSVVQNNLLENNKTQSAALYEFDAGSRMLANEIYALIKQKTTSLVGVIVNETKQFGETSFYINFNDSAQNAFLVVKLQDTVYALTYKKELHPLIKQLLLLLSK